MRCLVQTALRLHQSHRNIPSFWDMRHACPPPRGGAGTWVAHGQTETWKTLKVGGKFSQQIFTHIFPFENITHKGWPTLVHKVVSGVSALTHRLWQPPRNAPQCRRHMGSGVQMMHEVGAEPPDHRTRSAGLETGDACQRTSHFFEVGGGGVSPFQGINGWCPSRTHAVEALRAPTSVGPFPCTAIIGGLFPTPFSSARLCQPMEKTPPALRHWVYMGSVAGSHFF